MCFGGPDIPDAPPPPPLPQEAKAPSTTPLKRRNTSSSASLPAGSTMLTGATGITTAQLNLGSSSLLGGGKP